MNKLKENNQLLPSRRLWLAKNERKSLSSKKKAELGKPRALDGLSSGLALTSITRCK